MIARRVTRATRGSLHGRLWPLLFVLSVGCLSGPPSRPTNLAAGDLSYLKEYMTWYMRKSMDAGELTGLSFALVDADGPLWTGGLGFADREAGLPADERSIYMVASISKMITAAAVMQLRERGKLNLDAPLARAIPEFRIRSRFAASAEPAASGVTLRNILSHHSGLPSDYLYGFYYRRTQAPADLREGFLMLPDLLGDEYLSASPGRLFAYSNLGYSLAGLAVAHIAAASENENASFGAFENYIQTNLFAPLRMPDSSFAPPKTPTFSAPGGRVYAQAYAAGARVPAPALRDLPAGGLFSSAADLGNFTRMLLNQGRGPGENARILAPDSVREMLSIQNAGATLDGEFQIGAGLFLRPREFTGVVTAGHGGDLPPFHASVMFSPDLGLGAVVLTNSSSSSADMNQIAGEFLRAAVEARSGSKASPRRALPPALSAARRAACDDCARYASYAGEYEAGFGILRVLYEADEPANLFLEIQGSRLEMIPRVGGDFSVQYRLLGLIPIDVPALRSMRVRFLPDPETGRTLVGIYAEEIPVTIGVPINAAAERANLPIAWRKRLGPYRVCNRVPGGRRYELLRNIKLLYDSEKKILKLASLVTVLNEEPMILPLRWLDDQSATVYGMGRHQGDTLRVESNPAGDILWYSGFRLCPAADGA